MQDIEILLEESSDIPSLPEIFIRVSELIESDVSTVQEIGEALQTDPSLTSRILKLINSAFYGLANEVSSIPQAVSLLGRTQLSNLLTGSVLTGLFDDVYHEHFSLHEFWKHSIKTAIISRHLAMQNANIIDHDAFFTAGLLHDIGQLVIIKVDAQAYDEIQLLVETGMDICQAEQQILGFDHTDLSSALLHKWGLPSLLIQCADKHHDIEHKGPFKIDTCIVYLANILSRYDLPESEEDAKLILQNILNWQATECTLDQISVACGLAEEQALEVMESLGMMDLKLDI